MINNSNNKVKNNYDTNNSEIFRQGKPNNENQNNSFQDELAKFNSSNSLEETKSIEKKNDVSYNEENNNNIFNLSSIKNENENNNINSVQNDFNSEFSTSFNINTELNFPQIIFLLFHKFTYCQKCKSYLIINLTSNYNYIDIECECSLIKNITLEKFKEEYCTDDFLGGVNECKKHKKEYKKYCTDCRENLCEECEKEETKSEKGKRTVHETHTLNQADLEFVKENKPKIKKMIEGNKNLDIFCLINNYLDSFDDHPSYYKFIAIKNIVSFIEKYPQLPKNFYDKNIKLEEEKMIKIHTLDELEKEINKEVPIYEIDIKNKNVDKTLSLDIFENKEFKKLETLILNRFKINSIKSLLKCKFPNLKILDLEKNEITNECIDIFKKIDLPKIEFISVFENKITSIRILEVMTKFKSLVTLFVGRNMFDEDEINTYNKPIKLPEKLIELGLTENFKKGTIKFLKKIYMRNVQILYLSGNSFNSLDILRNCDILYLKEIWLTNTISNIEEITHLNNKGSIEIINISGNKFGDNNIKKLINYIESFPKLKKLILRHNGIEQKTIDFIRNEINNKPIFKNRQLKIEYVF